MITPISQGLETFEGVTSLVVLAILGFAMVAVASRCVKSVNIRLAAVLSMVAGFFVLLALIAGGRYLLGDENVWHALGLQAADYLTGITDDRVTYVEGKEGYVWIVGALYAISGPVPLVPILSNVIFSALTVVSVARTTELVVDDFPGMTPQWRTSAVRTAAFLTALLPAFFVWTPRILRESLGVLLISVAVLGCAQLVRTRKFRYLCLVLAAVVCLSLVRGPIGMALGVALAVAAIFVWSRNSPYHLAIRFFLLIPLMVVLVGAWNLASAQFGLSTEEVALRNRSLASDASSGFSGADETTGTQGYATILLINVPRILAGPFFWEFNGASASMLFAFLEGAIWVVAAIFAARAIWIRRRLAKSLTEEANIGNSGTIFILILATAALLATMSISVANYGLLARLRPMALVIILPLAAVAICYRPIRRAGLLMPPQQQERGRNPHNRGPVH